MKFTSLKQAATLVSAVIAGLVIFCGSVGIGSTWWQSSALAEQQAAADLLRNHMNADMMHDAIRADVLALLTAQDPSTGLDPAEIKEQLGKHIGTLEESLATDAAYKKSPAVTAAAAELEGPVRAYTQEANRIAGLADSDAMAARARLPEFFRQFGALEESLEAAGDVIQGHSREVAKSAESVGKVAMAILIGVLMSALVAAVGVGRGVRTHLVGPLVELVAAVEKLAAGDRGTPIPASEREDELGNLAAAVECFREQLAAADLEKQAQAKLIVGSIGDGLNALAMGDLTVRIAQDLPPPFGSLKSNFNAALAALCDLIGSVTESAGSIRTGSTEIAQAAEDLARRTESTAASLEQTSAAVTHMDGRLKATAGAATETVKRADQTIATVVGGRSVADDAVQAMGRVSESAKGIDSVIEGLDKIAFQTRVLAMNAAVEAGRAGEAGRGFAVVADLVSALAMRAEEEAKLAREQLTVTQTDIVTAVQAVEKVDAALQNISTDVGEVHQLLATIANDNQAQASAITQINAAIGSMDQATQQNAAMVEETSAAARNLQGEVLALATQAGRFEVSDIAGKREFTHRRQLRSASGGTIV